MCHNAAAFSFKAMATDQELKISRMSKKSVNKTIFSRPSYKLREFVLTPFFVKYFEVSGGVCIALFLFTIMTMYRIGERKRDELPCHWLNTSKRSRMMISMEKRMFSRYVYLPVCVYIHCLGCLYRRTKRLQLVLALRGGAHAN